MCPEMHRCMLTEFVFPGLQSGKDGAISSKAGVSQASKGSRKSKAKSGVRSHTSQGSCDSLHCDMLNSCAVI